MPNADESKAFREAIRNLSCPRQRTLAALFVENVLSLSDDERIPRIIALAASENPSQEALDAALKSAKAAIIASHTRCGADCDWEEQASYFVARAAAAAVAPEEKCVAGAAAWQAAVSCRMARTCAAIDIDAETAIKAESEQELRILDEFLNT